MTRTTIGAVLSVGALAAAAADPSPPAVVRTALLTAALDGGKQVDRVEIKQIDLGARQKSGAFDAGADGARFIAYYLLAKDDRETIHMFP